MKRWGTSVLALVAAGLLAGCSASVRRISNEEVVDLSGRWNDTDSKLVAEEMVKDSLSRPWLSNFLRAKGKNPIVIVGTIRNKTDEHIAIDTFQKDIERNLTNAGSVNFVSSKGERDEMRAEREDQQTNASEESRKQMYSETGADFMLQGTISKITDATYGKATFFYKVDMEMVDMQQNLKVWLGTKEIKKFLTRPGVGL